MTCMFECFQSHCHILKELHDVFGMMSASTIFGEGGFVFNFVSYGLMTKPLGVGCPMYVNPFSFFWGANKRTLLSTKEKKNNHLARTKGQNPGGPGYHTSLM